MTQITRIHKSRQPNRPHFIPEWAEARGFKSQTQLADALNADKSVVSRWYRGTSPTTDYQKKLSALFHCDEEALFRHPDDDWITRFFRDRKREEIEKIKQMLEIAFPRKDGTHG